MAAYTSQPPISVTVESGQALSPIKTGIAEQEESMENLGYTSVPALLKYLRQAEQLGLDIDRALAAAGRLDDAWLVERGTMPDQRVARLADIGEADCPYFAIVLVHGQGRRRP